MFSFKGTEEGSPLVVAAFNGITSEVESLLQKDPSLLDTQGSSALQQACLHGHSKVVKALLHHQSLSTCLSPDEKINILMDTVKKGHATTLHVLFESGYFQAGMKEVHTSCTVLFHACVFGHQEVVQQLASASNVNEATMQKVTPLMTAALYQHHKIIPKLIKYGANVNAQTSDGTSVLMCGILSKNVKTVKILLQAGVDTSLTTKMGTTALMLATKVNIIEIIAVLLKSSRTSINRLDTSGKSALMMACERVDDATEEVLILLIKYGADFDKDVDGRKVLLWASFHGFLSTVKVILKENATDVDTRGPSNETALMIAAEQGFMKIVKYLISQKADINMVSSYLGTALHYAAAANREDVIRYLIRLKPKIVRNQNGKTPSVVAKHNKHSAVQKILEDYEKKMDVRPYPENYTKVNDGDACPNDDTTFLRSFLHLLKRHMHTAPVVSQLYNQGLLSGKVCEDLRSWGPFRQAEHVTDHVIGPQLTKQLNETVIQQALLESRNHVNRELARLLTLRNEPNCMEQQGWKVFLTDEEQSHIKKCFRQKFLENARIDKVILHLRNQCALDDWQIDALKVEPSLLKATILVDDILLRGTVQTLNLFRQALQSCAAGPTDGHLLLLNCLPPARGVTLFEQLYFNRNKGTRISQRMVYFQEKINTTNNQGKADRVTPPYQRQLRPTEYSRLRVSVKDRIKLYERAR